VNKLIRTHLALKIIFKFLLLVL